MTKSQNTITLLLFSTAILFFSIPVDGQHYRYGSQHRNSIDIVVGGDIGFRVIGYNTTDPDTEQMAENREENESYKLNHRIGLNYYQGLNSKLLLKTGIRLSNPGFSTNFIEPIDINQDINTIEKTYDREGRVYKYKYQIVEIPLGLKYTLSGSFCEPYFELGIAPSFYWKTIVQEDYYEEGSENTTITENINRINFIGFASIGGNYTIANNMSGFVQLITRYQLNNLRKGQVVEKIVGLGLEVGVRYHI